MTESVEQGDYFAFADESSCLRTASTQEYLVGAALVAPADIEAIRDELLPLRLPGQLKLHWTDESSRRQRMIVEALRTLGPMTVVVRHLSERKNKTERFRRKCMEALYYELAQMKVYNVTFESRSKVQDTKDVAHIVALQGQGLEKRIRIRHLRGGDEPLLWISDAVLGAVNASHLGEPDLLECLQETIVLEKQTLDSLPHDVETSEKP